VHPPPSTRGRSGALLLALGASTLVGACSFVLTLPEEEDPRANGGAGPSVAGGRGGSGQGAEVLDGGGVAETGGVTGSGGTGATSSGGTDLDARAPLGGGGTTGTGGAPTDGDGRAPDCCDCDGDGFDGPQCGGDDCDDSDSRVFPGQELYFATETIGGGFDYDCDGSEEKEHTQATRCNLLDLGDCTTQPEGFLDPLPACGAPGEYGVCKSDLVGCSKDVQSLRTMRCR
jgi:hypothetical protein